MTSLLAHILWKIADLLFSLSLFLHQHSPTPFWHRAEEGIGRVEERLEEMRQLEAMGEINDDCGQS
jgi:hypothetical protein